MFVLKRLSLAGILLFASLALVVVPTVSQLIPSASALSPTEQQNCYNKLDGETIGKLGSGWAPFGIDITSDQINACVESLQCTATSSVTLGTGSLDPSQTEKYTFTCANPAFVQSNTIALEVAPLVDLVCGTSSGGGVGKEAYDLCTKAVKNAYEKCRKYVNDGYGGQVLDKPSNIAKCVVNTLSSGYKVSVQDATKAIEQGRADAGNWLVQQGQQTAKQTCEQDKNNDGVPDGTYDSTNGGSCSENLTGEDNCPLPSDAQMRWLGCAAFLAGKDAADALRKQLSQFLYTDVAKIFDNDASKAAATTFRNIGFALIVIAGLAMVIAQASGSDLVDAYTIRKLMPRLAVAMVGIALAWPLMRFAVTLTNDLGVLIYNIMMQVANNAGAGGDSVGVGSGIATVLGLIVGGGYLIVTLGVAGIVSLIWMIVLAILIGVFVLAVRQLVIFMAVLLAPLAIAAYVLPGTQKLWEFWKNTFITSLVMYPIIMGFIGAGAAMSYLLGLVQDGSAPADSLGATSILAVIVYFAPYFLLPFAFKLAGGLMSTVFSLANDRSRGLFDRGRKKREGIREDRKTRADQNSLWDPNSKFQKAVGGNRFASAVIDPYGNLAHAGRNIPGLRKKGQGIESSINAARVQQTQKLFEEMNNQFGNNDKAYRVLSGAHDQLSAPVRKKLYDAGLLNKRITSLDDMQRTATIMSENGTSDSEILAGNAISAGAGRLANLYKDPEMTRADITAASMMGLAAHGFANGDDLAATGNLLVKGGMSAGAAQSLVTQAQVMGSRGRPDIKAGYGITFDKDKGFQNGMKTGRDEDLLLSLSSHDVAGAKSGFMDEMEGSMSKILNAPNLEKLKLPDGTERDFTPEERRLQKAKAKAMEEQIFSWAGPYSQASADVKAKAQVFIEKRDDLRAGFARYTRMEDPELRRGGGPSPDEGGGPGGPSGGGPGK